MKELIASSERQLRAAGKRITPQRRLVLRILAGASDHLDAQDIYERARDQDSRLSLATVYRTLAALKETGVVHELHLDDEHHHYELAAKEEHSHLVCLSCGCVIEVDIAAFSDVALAVGQAHGFEVATAQVELAGYCQRCTEEYERASRSSA
jgi:Fe2+ or Zn2+ uptake regulation protein